MAKDGNNTRLVVFAHPGGDNLVGFVSELKRTDGEELRTVGSLSQVWQLLQAGLVDCLKLVVCPLILGETGVEPIFEGRQTWASTWSRTGFWMGASCS